jgi:hypothetical protein
VATKKGNGGDQLDSILGGTNLDPSDRLILARALGLTDVKSADFLDRVLKLRELALTEFVDWLIGRRRFNSISESDLHRIVELFFKVREEAPSVDSLVSQLTIPVARATSLLGRARYGEGRSLTILAAKSAASKLEANLAKAKLEGGDRKSVYVDSDTYAYIRRAAMLIMVEPESQDKGGKFEGAQMPDFTSYGRDGGLAKTTMKMWKYIIARLRSADGLM